VIGVLKAIEAFIRDTDQLLGLFSVLRKGSHAMIHAYAHAELKGVDHLYENRFDSATQRQRLFGIRLRQEESEFIASDAKGGVGSAKSFLQRSGGGAKDIVATGMSVLIVDFFKAVQIKND
jgi:hypothetical protein